MQEWDKISHIMDQKCEIVGGHRGKARNHEEIALIILAINAKLHSLMELIKHDIVDMCTISWTMIDKIISEELKVNKNYVADFR
jgi:hypothetical protein